MTEIAKSELREVFRALSNEAEKYFAAAASTIPEEEPGHTSFLIFTLPISIGINYQKHYSQLQTP